MCDAVQDIQQAPDLIADALRGLRHALLQPWTDTLSMRARSSKACDNAYCAVQVLWYKLRDANPDAGAQEMIAELERRLDDLRIQARKTAAKAGLRGT